MKQYTHAWVHPYIQRVSQAYMHICIQLYTHTYIHAYKQPVRETGIHTNKHTYVHPYIEPNTLITEGCREGIHKTRQIYRSTSTHRGICTTRGIYA